MKVEACGASSTGSEGNAVLSAGRRLSFARLVNRALGTVTGQRATNFANNSIRSLQATFTGSIPPALNRAKLSQGSPVLGRRHARGPPKRAGEEARLRGKPGIKSNLGERRASRRDHCFGALQPPLADVAMRRHAHGGGKCAGEMKDAKTRDIGKVGDGDVFSEMLFDVCENTPQPSVIQPMWRPYR